MIPVYENDEIVGEVEYNSCLDYWDGNNWTCGGVGVHKGLDKLGDEFVLIHGSQWQGSKDYGEIISPREAVQEILSSGNTELFDEYPELQEVRENLRKPKKENTICFRVSESEKNRYLGLAEAEGVSLSDWILSKIREAAPSP